MNKPLRDFIDTYFGIRTPRLIVPPSVRRRARGISTVIIDSDALSDGTITFAQAYSHDAAAPRIGEIAARATVGHTSPQANKLRTALDNIATPYDPVSVYAGKFMRSSWHHGQNYKNYWLGEVTQLIRYADLTENEREQLLLWTRKAGTAGRRVFATGLSTTCTLPGAFPERQSLTTFGVVAFHQSIDATSAYTIQQMREQGIRVVYASSDDMATTTMLAHASCLLPAAILPHNASQATTKSQVIGNLTPQERVRFINRFDPERTLVVSGSLRRFWLLLRQLR